MMTQFLRFDISLFSVLLLLMMLFIMHLRKETLGVSNKLFKRIVWVNIYMLLLEILTWQFDRQPGQWNYHLNYFFNMLFAWSTPLITIALATYIDYKMFQDIQRLKIRRYYMPILGVVTLLIGLNFFYPLIFSVDGQNIYIREPFMWLLVAINSSVHFYLIYIAYNNRSSVTQEVVSAILLFVFIPAIASVLQVLIFGVFILWPSMAVIIVITYIFLETMSTSKDYLTGLFSRLRADQLIDHLIIDRKSFGVLMIDLNNFKQINDQFGHRQGDRTLIEFGNALKDTFANEKIVARYGGDEFLVVTNILSEEQLERYRHRLSEQMKRMLSFSMGYQGTDQCDVVTYEQLLNTADMKMYEDKKNQKMQ